jgi:TonB family protein
MALRPLKQKPILPISPTIIDDQPPKIEESFQYGNPLAQASQLAPGPGFDGIGGGSASGVRGSAGDRFGHGRGSFLGRVVYRMGEVTKVPVLVFKVAPDYSDEARAARCHGTVLLGVIIDETGRPRDIHVLKPLGLGLDEKAVEAVGRWRFSPGLKDGQPVCVAANVEVNFQLL